MQIWATVERLKLCKVYDTDLNPRFNGKLEMMWV